MIPFLALLLGLLALVLFWQAGRQRKATGLPGGRVIYADTRAWAPPEKPLYDPELNLAGKPDYLVQQGNIIIPVEVKSTRGGAGPYDFAHLPAGCLLRAGGAYLWTAPSVWIAALPQSHLRHRFHPNA